MKLRPSSVICALLAASLVANPLAGIAADQPVAPKNSVHIASIMLEDISASAAKVMSKVDSTTINTIDAEKTAVAQKAIDDQIEATKKSDADVEAIREEARHTAVSEAKRSKDDLINKIMGASTETLDRYGEALKANAAYADFAQEYAAAYTRTEKARILTAVVSQDMDQVLTASLKRLNWLTAEGLRGDLQALKNRVFAGKGDGDKKIKRILLIAGAAVAFVGLATWGIASIKYGNIYSKQRNELETAYQARKKVLDDQFAKLQADLKGQRDNLAAADKAELDALVAKLQANYNALSDQLKAQELKYLNDNGYVWMQCNSYSQTSSILCNNYDYKVFVGTSTCTVMCYKNVSQGKETLQAAPVCSSPYIPADCFSQAKYDAEYNAGYTQGYNHDRPIGEADGRKQGTIDGQNTGHADGSKNGDADGYHDGYNDGYNYEYSKAYTSGYNDRYNSGYEDGYNAGYNDSYNEGYNDGYSDGYNSVPTGMILSSSKTIQMSSSLKVVSLVASFSATPNKPQFDVGYKDGYRDAKLAMSLRSNK